MARLFRRRPSLVSRLLLAVLAALLLLFLDQRTDRLVPLRGALLTALHPLQQAVDLPFRMYAWCADNLRERAALRAEAAALREQNLLLKLRVQALDALQAENRRLQALLDSLARTPQPLRALIASTIRVGLDPYIGQIEIDKGSLQGVFVGQPVLDADGVVGQVAHVAAQTSQVLLITDARHAIPVKSVRSGVRAIAVGRGPSGELDLPYLPNHVDIEVGDALVTSGLDDVFPPDLPVATVSVVNRIGEGEFADIRAVPRARLDRTQEVLLVWPPQATPLHGAGDTPAPTP
ncbi:rod shape-determining protein MreC [Immundisolibacter sp.]|uniref:rod shape-determining protein MreC n=1 Tax=Immundisolibacter sp. TaxID=1934948 RepID=UPI0026286C5E|nr:rod shape-determining protein MreC [Immundisolibacter sp.]MDD3650778.1 rod shape-determining protein MreC [Immundisolibacter sp.]